FKVDDSDVKVGGALYEHINNPFIPLSKKQVPLSEQILTQFKLQGILLNDEELLDNFDTEARTSKNVRSSRSPVVSFGKDNVISDDDLFKILNYNRRLIKQAGEKRSEERRVGKDDCSLCLQVHGTASVITR